MNTQDLDGLISRLRDDLRMSTDTPSLTLLAAAAEVWLQRDTPDADAAALRDAASQLTLRLIGVTPLNVERLKEQLVTGRETPASLDRRQ